MDPSTWTVPDHNMHSVGDDEFQQYLDMNGMGTLPEALNFDFHDFQQSAGSHAHSHSQMLQPSAREHIDTAMTGTDAPMIMARTEPALQRQVPAMTSTAPYQSISTPLIQPPTPSEAIVDSIDAQIQFLQQQKMQHQHRQMEEQQQQAALYAYQQSRAVPPTPQSLELAAGANSYYMQSSQPEHQQAIDYRYQRLKVQQDMSFTPLVSPAVTPLETHFPIDTQFAIPGAYFSPLTSPALHAQNDSMLSFDQTLGAATASSPAEMDLDATVPILPNATPGDLGKKLRKNTAKARGIKQSPISKPLRRKTATTPTLNPQIVSELVENAERNQDRQRKASTPLARTSGSSAAGTTDSENGSVSPQALTDTVSNEMPPPPIPKPKSAKPSPFIAAQDSHMAATGCLQQARPGVPSPATPASLMKLASPNNRTTVIEGSSGMPLDTDHIENFELPESAGFSQPIPTPILTQGPQATAKESDSSTTPGLHPLPSPASGHPNPSSVTQSPQLAPTTSSSSRKTPQLLPRNSRKRPSVSSIQVSPALRPKLSPNIMPLLPGGSLAEDAASQLLASKSNYQRILEGNTVPGVSYPSELSTNLTSKRTSHKIAEQGRRNRINSALQEMATLLPRASPNLAAENSNKESEGDSGGDKKDKAALASGPSSKASTVEMAIDYIKQLQREVAEANRRAEEAERKLGAKSDG